MTRALVLSGAACLAFFALHGAVFAARRIELRFRALVRQFAAVGAAYLLAFWLLPAGMLRDPWPAPPAPWRLVFCLAGLGAYAAVFLGYLEFYFTADRSITVRIMREILGSPEGEITQEAFKARFDTEEQIFRRRFRELVESGYLSADGPRYRLTPKGAFVGALYDRVIRALNLDGG